MNDPRYRALARVLIRHSTGLQAGEHLLIETWDTPEAMVEALVAEARAVGGRPHLALRSSRSMRFLVDGADEATLSTWAEIDRFRMERMDAYVAIRGSENISEMAGIPPEQMQRWGRLYGKPVHFEQRVNHTRWVVLRWPTPSMAQLAGVSTSAFEQFYFDVCTIDYAAMTDAVRGLAERMSRTDEVRITGPGDTDLTFSIRGIPVRPCTGARNIPDGECFTAPLRDSVEGVMHYNAPSIYNGIPFDDVRLVFRRGRVVEASCAGDRSRLEAILDTDEGARFIGEFAIGFNPRILHPMRDILFDEKIAGSFHLTPGRAYEDADNGNRSEVHWDLVAIQRPEYGGGEIAFDGETIRRDGLFTTPDLVALNPDRLSAPA
jgi:aminopeptidase